MPNQYVNKVVYGGSPLIDLTSDDVTAADVAAGVWFHLPSGERVEGTASGGSTGSAYQDADGYIVLSDDESTAPQGNISITENGVYDVASYAAATVDVSGGGGGNPFTPSSDGHTHIIFSVASGAAKDVGLYLASANGQIDWGDGETSSASSATNTHTYQERGIYNATLPSGIGLIGQYSRLPYEYLGMVEGIEIDGIGQVGSSNLFYNLYGVKWAYIHDGSISSTNPLYLEYMFDTCGALQYCRLDEQLTKISNYMFRYCYSLREITIPQNVTSIGTDAFNTCRGLTSVTIPSGVTEIGNNAFRYCASMEEYHILPTNPPTLGTNAFYVTSGVKIYVPAASLSAYQSAWSAYSSYLVGE